MRSSLTDTDSVTIESGTLQSDVIYCSHVWPTSAKFA